MRYASAGATLVALCAACAGATPLVAQHETGTAVAWPRPVVVDVELWLGPVVSSSLPPVSQVAPRPVLDDAGVVIPYEVILARTDPDGTAGAVAGGAAGLLVGLVVGYGMAESVSCGRTPGGADLCSPQEDALRSTLTTIGIVGTGVVFAKLGHDMDETSWIEAIRGIRADRRRRAAVSGRVP